VSEAGVERRLTTILAADEAGTLTSLKAIRRELIEPKTAEYHGGVVKLMGDGALVEFASVVDAVQCAADVQRGMVERNAVFQRKDASNFAPTSCNRDCKLCGSAPASVR